MRNTFGQSESWHLLASLSCFYDATPTCFPLTSREMTCKGQHILPSLSLILRTNMLLQTPVLTSNPIDVQRNSAASHTVKKLRILELFIIICAYLLYKSAAVTLTPTILCNQCLPSPASCKRTTWQLACLSHQAISTHFMSNQF